MKTFLSILIIAIIYCKSMCFAEVNCFPSEMGNSAASFPDSISAKEIFKITGLNKNICGISMKKWPYQKNTYVVYAEDTLNSYIFLLKKGKSSFQIIARNKSELVDLRFKSFDFAPYKIRLNSTAIGIRLFKRGPTKGGAWECVHLILIEVVGNDLKLALSTVVGSTSEGNDTSYDTESYFSDEATSIIQIGKPDETGYNRIIKKSKHFKTIFNWNSENSLYFPEKNDDACGDTTVHCFCNSD